MLDSEQRDEIQNQESNNQVIDLAWTYVKIAEIMEAINKFDVSLNMYN